MSTDTSSSASTARAALPRLLRGLASGQTIGPFVALVLTMAFFSYKSDRFLHAQNLSLVMQQVTAVGVLAIGQTLVILTPGIDLACAPVMAFRQIVMTKLPVAHRRPSW